MKVQGTIVYGQKEDWQGRISRDEPLCVCLTEEAARATAVVHATAKALASMPKAGDVTRDYTYIGPNDNADAFAPSANRGDPQKNVRQFVDDDPPTISVIEKGNENYRWDRVVVTASRKARSHVWRREDVAITLDDGTPATARRWAKEPQAENWNVSSTAVLELQRVLVDLSGVLDVTMKIDLDALTKGGE